MNIYWLIYRYQESHLRSGGFSYRRAIERPASLHLHICTFTVIESEDSFSFPFDFVDLRYRNFIY